MNSRLDRSILDNLGIVPQRIVPLSPTNNAVFTIETAQSERFFLKRFERSQQGAYRRELGTRELLRRFSALHFPEVIRTMEEENAYYLLMEHIAGERLKEIWDDDHERAGRELPRLAEVLAALHRIPVVQARGLLAREELLYSQDYFTWMFETIAPYLNGAEQRKKLDQCYNVVSNARFEEVVIHGDFGPHQVIVDPHGRWVLTDFEYAARSPFVDDLAGAALRLEQAGYPHVAAFPARYRELLARADEYEAAIPAFKAYNLLAMLTYGIANLGKSPPTREIERLERLLAESQTLLLKGKDEGWRRNTS